MSDTTQNATTYVWYVASAKAGANTVTLTPTSAAALEIHVSEWIGISAASPVDQTASATDKGTNISSGAKTTTQNGELIYGFAFVGNSATARSGFKALTPIDGDTDEYQVQATAGSIAATFTESPSGNWFDVMATFRPASAGMQSAALTSSGLTTDPSSVQRPSSITGPTVTLIARACPVASPQRVMLQATVASAVTGAGIPTGTVTFFDGNVAFGTVSLVAGRATLTTKKLALGNHRFTADYRGDASFRSGSSAVTTERIGTSDKVLGRKTHQPVSGRPSGPAGLASWVRTHHRRFARTDVVRAVKPTFESEVKRAPDANHTAASVTPSFTSREHVAWFLR